MSIFNQNKIETGSSTQIILFSICVVCVNFYIVYLSIYTQNISLSINISFILSIYLSFLKLFIKKK